MTKPNISSLGSLIYYAHANIFIKPVNGNHVDDRGKSLRSRRLLRVFIKPDSRGSIARKPKYCTALVGSPRECRISPRRGSRNTKFGRLQHSLAITSARSRTDVARPVQTLNTVGSVETPSMARISARTTSPT